MSTGTILGEELRQGRQADKRDAQRFRALAAVDLLAWLPILKGSTLAELADKVISVQHANQKTHEKTKA